MAKWLALLTLATFTTIFFALKIGQTSPPKPPNIIFILADDLDVDLFNQDEKLPTLLSKQGTTFVNHFAPLSLCCPSRVSTLRGQFPHNTSIYTNTAETGGGFEGTFQKGLEKSTIATWLQKAGYRTALLGKYLNGYPNSTPRTYIPPGWTYWLSPNGGYFQSQFNFSFNENGKTVPYASEPHHYLGDVLIEKTVGFIKDCTTNYPNQPFFAFVTPITPHKPAAPPTRYQNYYRGVKAPRTPSFNEGDVGDKPEWVNSQEPLTAEQIASLDELYRLRKASLLGLADLVEKVIDTLEATDQLDNTYIFFSSDNGFHQGQHRLNSGKTTAYEEDIKIPLVVRGPHVAANKIIDAITANVDYAPTFAAIAGIEAASFVDGRSLLPFLQGRWPTIWRQALLLEFGGPASITKPSDDPLMEVPDDFDLDLLANAKKNAPAFTGLRIKTDPFTDRGPLTFVLYHNEERELYYLGRDPYQLNNAYGVADKAVTTKYESWLKELQNASGEKLRQIEQSPP